MRSGPPTLADVVDDRNNNLDVVRLVAASIVLVSHCYPLTGRAEPLGRHGLDTLGGIGVATFFAMSGMLITRSWQHDPSVGRYAHRRALRILPGLWVNLLFVAVVIGALATTQGVLAHLLDPRTWWYVARDMFVPGFGASLPHVFASNPVPRAANGSLWTLPLEVSCYVGVAVLGARRLLRSRVLWPALALVTVAFCLAPSGVVFDARAVAYFAVGMLAVEHRSRILLSWRLAAGAACALVLAGALAVVAGTSSIAGRDLLFLTELACLPYLALVVGYRTPLALRRLTTFGDLSYGIYIYAFPLQQLVVDRWPGNSTPTPLELLAIAGPLTWLAALASWHFVERPALRHKPRRRDAPDRPVAQATGVGTPPATIAQSTMPTQ